MSELDPNPFADSLAQLESRIADAVAAGEPVPPQAYEMLESLRALNGALVDLRATFGARPAAPPPADASDSAG